MDNYPPGSLVSLPFPYADRLAESTRPALVVNVFDQGFPHTLMWVVMVTTARAGRWPGDIPVTIRDLRGTDIDCFIRPAKLATTAPQRVSRVLGQVDPETLATCADWLANRFRILK